MAVGIRTKINVSGSCLVGFWLEEANADLKTLQDVLGHSIVRSGAEGVGVDARKARLAVPELTALTSPSERRVLSALRVTDSTPVECGRSRPTVKRSELAGWAGYGYCASHSRFFWGLRLHLICTPSGLPIAWSLATAKSDERQVLAAALEDDPGLLAARPGQLIIADKGYVSAELDRWLAERGARLLRPSYRNRTPHPDEHLLKPIRQLIESVNETLKGQLDLELHGGCSIEGVGAQIAQRILAMTAAIWHNQATGQHLTRSLIAYDH